MADIENLARNNIQHVLLFMEDDEEAPGNSEYEVVHLTESISKEVYDDFFLKYFKLYAI